VRSGGVSRWDLENTLPDETIPSICGLAMSEFLTAPHVGCPVDPEGETLMISQPVTIQRSDGLCLTEDNLVELEDAFALSYNNAKQSLYDTCDSSYRKILSMTVVASWGSVKTNGSCQSQTRLMETMPW
jgi:hypothetical protein